MPIRAQTPIRLIIKRFSFMGVLRSNQHSLSTAIFKIKSVIRSNFFSVTRIIVETCFRIIGLVLPINHSWVTYCYNELCITERYILSSVLKVPYNSKYVDVGGIVGPEDKIWTIFMNSESTETPIVLLHGVGTGVALWCQNLIALAKDRPVYALDLLGFARSSRPTFSKSARMAEKQFIESLETWRFKMKLEKMILAGHHLGGFLATSYAMHYPHRVKHLILVDPWGLSEKPLLPKMSRWVKVVAYLMYTSNLLSLIRCFGPWGLWTINFVRADMKKKFSGAMEEYSYISRYIYHCNAQTPSGETAFNSMTVGMGWAKYPMIRRIELLDKNIPISFIYGSRVNYSIIEVVKEKRRGSYVALKIINGAGQHVYADKPTAFNKYMVEACKYERPEEKNADQGGK